MTNTELITKINDGSCLLGEAVVLKPDGSVVDADGRQLMPPDETRAGIYTNQKSSPLPGKVASLESSVSSLDATINSETGVLAAITSLNDGFSDLANDPYKNADIVIKSNKALDDESFAVENLELYRGEYADLIATMKREQPLTAYVVYAKKSGTSNYEMENYTVTYVEGVSDGYREYIGVYAGDFGIFITESGLTLVDPT